MAGGECEVSAATGEPCPFRCKCCGVHTHLVLRHRIRPWHEVQECVCEACLGWVRQAALSRTVVVLDSPVK